MQSLAVNLFRITVVFNPSNFSILLLCDDIRVGEAANNGELRIPQGVGMIGLYIMTLPGGDGSQAVFADPPITWEQGISANAFIVQSWTSGHVTIIDFNTVREVSQHPFLINVLYDGQTHTSDPTIINDPPIE